MNYDSTQQQTVLFGGLGTTGPCCDTWGWNGVAWTELTETGPPARFAHSMAYDGGRDRTVLFGGVGAGGDGTFGDTWEWNGSLWTLLCDYGPQPCLYAALAFKKDSVALFGGVSELGQAQGSMYGTTWTWDGNHWTLRQDFGPPPRFAHAMSYDSTRDTLVLFGGILSSSVAMDTWEHTEGP